jgi:hypothetical protein
MKKIRGRVENGREWGLCLVGWNPLSPVPWPLIGACRVEADMTPSWKLKCRVHRKRLGTTPGSKGRHGRFSGHSPPGDAHDSSPTLAVDHLKLTIGWPLLKSRLQPTAALLVLARPPRASSLRWWAVLPIFDLHLFCISRTQQQSCHFTASSFAPLASCLLPALVSLLDYNMMKGCRLVVAICKLFLIIFCIYLSIYYRIYK